MVNDVQLIDIIQDVTVLGPGFLLGFSQGFLIAAFVGMIRVAVRLFKKIILKS